MLRVAKYSLAAASLLALLSTAACGGSKKPPTSPPEEAIDAGSAAADMPAPADPTASADAGAASDHGSTQATAEPPAPAKLDLPTATAKAALKGKKPATIEIKSDGTVSNAGKAVAKISGMALQNADGSKSLLTVGSDGAVTAGEAATAYGSFTGDILTLAKGDNVTVADDGAVSWTTGGKPAPLGKFENLGSAKKAAALAVAFVVAPPAAEKAAPAGKKPADGKPADAKKPAPKK